MKLSKVQYLEIKPSTDCCKYCSDVIWYPHTLITNQDGQLSYFNGTFKTIKNIGNSSYSLNTCYLCLCKEFPEINSKNPSKLFNTCNKYVKFAFLVTDSDFSLQKKKHGITLEKMIHIYGKDGGTQKWLSYCEQQKVTNCFEYKHEKFGWTRENFINYNKSRAITKKNLITKYGERDAIDKWENYINRQKYTKSLAYLIEKFGKAAGYAKYLKINQAKALTLNNYILKYGLSEGTDKFKQMILKKDAYFSKASQLFFKELDEKIAHLNLSIYYHSKNGEFGKLLTSINKYCKLDFYIKELNLTIEYNGDYWHANPKFYKSTDLLYNNKRAKEIWKSDDTRRITLLTEHNITAIIVWQNDDIHNHANTINELVYEIERKIRKN